MSRIVGDLARAAQLAVHLARYEIRAQRQETFLGLLWLVLWPVAQAGGFLAAFQLARGGGLQLDGPALLAAYFGVLIWTTASGVLTANLTILKANRDLIAQVVFPAPILSVVDVTTRFVYFLAQLAVALGLWIALAPDGPWPAVLLSLLCYLAGLYLALLAMAWLVSIFGVVLPDLSFMLPPVLTLLLVLSPVFQPKTASLPQAVQMLNGINPLSWWVTAWQAAVGVADGGPHPPWLFAAGSAVAVVVVWAIVKRFYPEAMKVI
jgi:lipopolysaccharide transport system permease protein